MTSKTLLRLLEMARDGCTDREIGKAVGVAPSTVSYYRKKAGIDRTRGQACRTLYALYDRDGQYLFEGSLKYVKISRVFDWDGDIWSKAGEENMAHCIFYEPIDESEGEEAI